MNTNMRNTTLPHQQPVEQQMLAELKELRRVVEQISVAIKLSQDLRNGTLG